MNTPSTSIIVVLAFLGSSCGFGERESDRRQSIVQIRTRDGKIQGSGIVIQGPDQQADQFYVATLYEIINTGEPIVVDSFVPAPSSGAGKYFLQEYPNTEIVAYDAMSNAAIIHVKNVPADYIQPLVLSKAEEIVPQSRVHVLGVLENRTSDNRRVHDAEAIVTNTHTFHARDHFLGRDLPNELEGFSVDTPFNEGYPGAAVVDAAGELIGIIAGPSAYGRGVERSVQTLAYDTSGIRKALAKINKSAEVPTIEDAQMVIADATSYLMEDRRETSSEVVEGRLLRHEEIPYLKYQLRSMLEKNEFLQTQCGDGREQQLLHTLNLLVHTLPQMWETFTTQCEPGVSHDGCMARLFRPYVRSLLEAGFRWDRRSKADYTVKTVEDSGDGLFRVRVQKNSSSGGHDDVFFVYIGKDFGQWKLSLFETKTEEVRIDRRQTSAEFKNSRWQQDEPHTDQLGPGVKRTAGYSIALGAPTNVRMQNGHKRADIEVSQKFAIEVALASKDRSLCVTPGLYEYKGSLERTYKGVVFVDQGVIVIEPDIFAATKIDAFDGCRECDCGEQQLPWFGIAVLQQDDNTLRIANASSNKADIVITSYARETL